jgi:6-pyruvoyltetrahydropterin/6-carboxytetrahydropterin synthase
VIAECAAQSLQEGSDNEQSGMVLEFSFLKEVMMNHIDRLCDHGMILSIQDKYCSLLLTPRAAQEAVILLGTTTAFANYYFQNGSRGAPTKLLVVGFLPTAENLARFWFELMEADIERLSNNLAKLVSVEVWETPNCSAFYYPKEKVALPPTLKPVDETVPDFEDERQRYIEQAGKLK